MMTRRENLLATLQHQPHDRLPVYAVIDGFNYPDPLPQGLDLDAVCAFEDPEGLVELSRYYGLDTLMRITPSPIEVGSRDGRVRSHTEDMGAGVTATYWETPRGTLRKVARQSPDAHTTFAVEHPIKELRDYEVLIEILESHTFALNHENLALTRHYLDVIGDEGIAYVVGPASPIMDLTRSWTGLQQFVFHLRDAPALVGTVLDRLAEDYCQQYELIAAHSPCRVMVLWDDANSLYLSPHLFEQYALPVLRRYAGIAHRHHKLLVNHTCGKIAAFVGLYPVTGCDSLDWVTPPPAGDVLPGVTQRAWGSAITMQLAVVPTVMRHGSPDDVEEHVRALLNDVDTTGNLVLMIPPPIGTPLANLRRAVEILVADYSVPLNRSARWGSVLDT